MKILIVSGFLGAGKTRFITELVKQTGRRFAIVENEFSSIDLDSKILREDVRSKAEKVAEGLEIWELTEGCICCSTTLDFTNSVMTIANTIDPEFLIIEPSGVGLPSRILSKLRNICYEQIGLLAPITIVDANTYQRSRQDFANYFSNQVNHAGTVVLSKSEQLDSKDFARIRSDLKLPADVDFPTQHYDSWPKEDWEKLLDKELILESLDQAKISVGRRFRIQQAAAPKALENFALTDPQIASPDTLIACLEILIRRACGHVVRAKGYVKTNQGYLRFDLVDGQYSVTGFSDEEDQRVVFIGENLRRDLLAELFGSTANLVSDNQE